MEIKDSKEIKAVFEQFLKPDRLGNVSWALIRQDSTSKIYLNSPCFLDLDNPNNENSKYFLFWPFVKNHFKYDKDRTIIKIEKVVLSKDEYDYIFYVANESIFSSCFVTKDPNEIFHKGSILKTNIPGPFMYAAACSIRYVSEKSTYITLWNKFKVHIDDDAAFLFAHFFFLNSIESLIYERDDYCGGSHSWIGCLNTFRQKHMKKFLDRNLIGMQDFPFFSEDVSYRNFYKFFDTDEENNPLIVFPRENNPSGIYKFKNLKKDLNEFMEKNHVL